MSVWQAPFFREYLALHPEEASTLGVREHASSLTDLSPQGIERSIVFFERVFAELATVHAPNGNEQERLDIRAVTSLASFALHELRDRRSYRTNLELSSFPHAMLAHQSAHAKGEDEWRSMAERASKVPLYLSQHEANLTEGNLRGEAVDTEIAQCFVDYVLPGAIAFLRGLGNAQPRHAAAFESAARAYDVHLAFVRNQVVPSSRENYAIGEAEVLFRLERFLGRPTSIDELLEDANACLKSAQTELVALAQRISAKSGGSVATHHDAALLFRKMWSVHPASLEEAFAKYREVQARAIAFVREKELFLFDESFQLDLSTIPPGIAVGTPAINWPAPLLDRTKSGGFLISPDPDAHSISGAANLAVHEGIPGHYLQSFAWQSRFSGEPHPVRFLCVCDDVAMARQYYGTMVSIEGFAAYVEELMLEQGFFSDEEALLSVVSKAIRAARVIADLSLHARHSSRQAVAEMLAEQTGMPLGWARGQVLRYSRIPLQALTYHVGCRQIWALKGKARAHAGFQEADFHKRLFDLGPVPPAVAESGIVL